MNIYIYIDKKVSSDELEEIMNRSKLNFLSHESNESLIYKGNYSHFTFFIEDSDRFKESFYFDDELIMSDLVDNLRVRPSVIIACYCENDLKGYDEICALSGYLMKNIDSSFIAELDLDTSNDFVKMESDIVISQSVLDEPNGKLYEKLLNGFLEEYQN